MRIIQKQPLFLDHPQPISEEIANRHLPKGDVPLSLLQHEMYGEFSPDFTFRSIEVTEKENAYCAGKATKESIVLHLSLSGEIFSFPIQMVLPIQETPVPCFVFLSFSNQIPNEFLPIEEIIDRGFAVAQVWYQSLTTDDTNFSGSIINSVGFSLPQGS